MKMHVLLFLFILNNIFAQDKSNKLYFNDLKIIPNSDYLVTFYENSSKIGFKTERNNELIFINSKTDSVHKIELSSEETISRVVTEVKNKMDQKPYVLVITNSENNKSLKVIGNYKTNLYFIALDSFEVIQLNSEDSSMIDFEFSEGNNKIVVIEKTILKEVDFSSRIIIFDFIKRKKKILYSN